MLDKRCVVILIALCMLLCIRTVAFSESVTSDHFDPSVFRDDEQYAYDAKTKKWSIGRSINVGDIILVQVYYSGKDNARDIDILFCSSYYKSTLIWPTLIEIVLDDNLTFTISLLNKDPARPNRTYAFMGNNGKEFFKALVDFHKCTIRVRLSDGSLSNRIILDGEALTVMRDYFGAFCKKALDYDLFEYSSMPNDSKYVYHTSKSNSGESTNRSTWICPACETENSTNFCTNCGEKQPTTNPTAETNNTETWICPTCGTENLTNFCGNCGEKKPTQGLTNKAITMSSKTSESTRSEKTSPVVLFEQDNCFVYATGNIIVNGTNILIDVLIDNQSDEKRSIVWDYCSVNGWSLEMAYYYDVAPMSKKKTQLKLVIKGIEDISTTSDVHEIKGKLRFTNTKNPDPGFEFNVADGHIVPPEIEQSTTIPTPDLTPAPSYKQTSLMLSEHEKIFIPDTMVSAYNEAIIPFYQTLSEDEDVSFINEYSQLQYMKTEENSIAYSNKEETIFMFFNCTDRNTAADTMMIYCSLKDNNAIKNLPELVLTYAISQLDRNISFDEFGAWANDATDGATYSCDSFDAYYKMKDYDFSQIMLVRKPSLHYDDLDQLSESTPTPRPTATPKPTTKPTSKPTATYRPYNPSGLDNDSIDEMTDLIIKGIDGNLTYSEAEKLKRYSQQLGIDLDDNDFR